MSISKSIAEGVNLLSGSERKEYAKYYEDVSAADFLEVIKAAGWKPRQGELMRDFDARIKALPIFSQLGLVDDGVGITGDGDASKRSIRIAPL